jgi:hypothetical protein
MLRMPDAKTILWLWERAGREHPVDRALSILAAFTSETHIALAALPINRRDALLLASRVAAFGNTLEGVATCPACDCKIDASLDLPDVSTIPSEEGGVVDFGGRMVSFRLPNSHDLAEAARAPDLATAEKILIERCQLTRDADHDEAQAIDSEIARLCDVSTLELRMACIQCQGEFVTWVDMVDFFWDELVSYAIRLIDDVDALAARYGWAEADILAMPEGRRRRYLERFQ